MAAADITVGRGGPMEAGDSMRRWIRAKIASLNAVDADGDLTLPGFFGAQTVTWLPAHDWSSVPLGKGVIYESNGSAFVFISPNMRIPQAKAWYDALVFDVRNPPPLLEWSYGYDVLPGGSKQATFGGQSVRLLQPRSDGSPGARVHEVSTVILGAGVGTSTVDVAGELSDEEVDAMREIRRSLALTMGGAS